MPYKKVDADLENSLVIRQKKEKKLYNLPL
jgi:hypothetical protein